MARRADCFVGGHNVDERCNIPVGPNLMNIVQVALAWSYLDYCAVSPFGDLKETNIDKHRRQESIYDRNAKPHFSSIFFLSNLNLI